MVLLALSGEINADNTGKPTLCAALPRVSAMLTISMPASIGALRSPAFS